MLPLNDYIKNPAILGASLLEHYCCWLPDQIYLKLLFRFKMGYKLDLKCPKTMNEKLQWLKLYDRRPEYTQLVDKVTAKEIVADKIGKEYIVPTLGVWNLFADIDFNQLPDQFVLKTNHSGGSTGVVICKDKSTFGKEEARKKLEKSLKSDISWSLREWPYRNVERKILAEEYLGDDLTDYKFYCFNGAADVVLNCIERNTGKPKFYFFDRDWNLCRLNKAGKEASDYFTLPKPKSLDEMFNIASRLSEGIPFARIDLYNINGKIYFSEITLYPDSGFDKNRLPEADAFWGEKIVLPTGAL